jgi:hypothetical protein
MIRPLTKHGALAPIVQETIIEWLRRRGAFAMPSLKRTRTLKRRIREHAIALLPVVATIAFIAGWFLGRR